MKYKYCIILLCLLKSFSSYTQELPPPGGEVQELVRIAEVYENVPYLSFNLRYTYADSLTWLEYTDSMQATCKISYGRTFIANDSFEVLRGKEYNVFVDKADSFIIISPRRVDESVFQMPLLDSVFREANVLSMNIKVINDSVWSFEIDFKPGSYYSFFQMYYDPRTGLILSVNYHGRNDHDEHDIPEDHVICAFVYMTDYSDEDLDPTLFNEGRYFYRLNGIIYLQPAWEQFEFDNY